MGNRVRCLQNHFWPSEAIAQARQAVADGKKLVVVNETNDNCGAGAPGDGTQLLAPLLAADWGSARVAFGYIVDSEAVAVAMAAGVGNKVQLKLGGKVCDRHGSTLDVEAYVKCITDGEFKLENFSPGLSMSLGPTVRLQVGSVDIIVTSRRGQTFDRVVFLLHGIDVRLYDVIALKSGTHFRAGF